MGTINTKMKRLQIIGNYNTFFILPAVSLRIERGEPLTLDISWFKLTFSITILKEY
jgi:hypothetical protein